MSKPFQLTIPKPCHEDWSKMTPDEKGRFCSSCQKQVVDFTTMNNQQLALFFKKPSTGSVCGRFNNDQLNQDLQVPQKRIPWLKYFFTIAVPTFFAVTKAKAQGEVTKAVKGQTAVKIVPDRKTNLNPTVIEECSYNITKIADTCEPLQDIIVGMIAPRIIPDERVITGKVIDEDGTPLAYASIKNKRTNLATASDSSGFFKITASMDDNILVASSVDYEVSEINISANNANPNVILYLKHQALMGLIIPIKVDKKNCLLAVEPPKESPLLTRIFKDSTFKNLKLFPNPALKGTTISIQWAKLKDGEFEIQLLDQSGQLINRKTEMANEKINSLQYSIPSVTPGSYFLVIINRKSGKKITEKIIIK